MNKNVAGVNVPDELIERIKGAENREEESVAITIELIQQLLYSLAGNRRFKAEPVEWLECNRVLVRKNDAHAGNPIGDFPMDQVTKNIERAE